ncbi:MAG: hypothetical protein AAFZ89_03335 [Bacteroidota bacterium]
MKNGMLWAALFLFSGTLMAQDNEVLEKVKKNIAVKQRTLMEQFEPDMVLSVDERVQLKRNRISAIQHGRSVLDTLDISDRKRRKLLKELYREPFSERLNKTLADTKFEEENQH